MLWAKHRWGGLIRVGDARAIYVEKAPKEFEEVGTHALMVHFDDHSDEGPYYLVVGSQVQCDAALERVWRAVNAPIAPGGLDFFKEDGNDSGGQ